MKVERKTILACDGCLKHVDDFAAVITYYAQKGDVGEPNTRAHVDLCGGCWAKLTPEVAKVLANPAPPKPGFWSRIFGGAR